MLYRFILPYSYAQKTRFNSLKDFFFHFYYEWIPAFLILLYSFDDWLIAIGRFALGFIAFTSIYELGYFANDLLSTKNEIRPRRRIANFFPKLWQIIVWVVIRILIFGAISYYLNVVGDIYWIVFYLCLIVSFILHNILRNRQIKLLTFINLAFFRFFAPFFIFIDISLSQILVPVVFLNYVLFRTLTYMDSKGLLSIPDRKKGYFKVVFYLLLFPINLILLFIYDSWIPLTVSVYFSIFWGLYFMVEKAKLLRI